MNISLIIAFIMSLQISGSDLYRTNCAGCHGFEGRGDGPVVMGRTPAPTDFTNEAFVYTAAELIADVKQTLPDLTLSDAEFLALAEYVLSLRSEKEL